MTKLLSCSRWRHSSRLEFELLMRRSGRVVTKEAIEESLYDFADEVGINAIEVQVHRLRKKLSAAGASVNVHTLRGVGYMLADAPA